MSFRRPLAPFMDIFADSNGDNRISETGRPRGRPFPLWDSRPRQQAPRHRRRRQRPRGTVRAGFSIRGGFFGKGGQILGRSDAWTTRGPRGQGGGKSFQQPRRRPSDSLTEISANFGAGICFFQNGSRGAGGAASAGRAGRAAILGGESCSSGATSGAICDDRGQNVQARGAGTVKSKRPSAQNPRKCGDQSSRNRRGNREK